MLNKWVLLDYVTLKEALYLLIGVDPDDEEKELSLEQYEDFKNIYLGMLDSSQFQINPNIRGQHFGKKIPVHRLKRWAKNKGIPIPKLLTDPGFQGSAPPIETVEPKIQGEIVALSENVLPVPELSQGTTPRKIIDSWEFLPKQEPSREHTKLILRGAIMAIEYHGEVDLLHSGSLSASSVARAAWELRKKWWNRQEKDEPPSLRKMAEHITNWIKAGRPDPESAPR